MMADLDARVRELSEQIHVLVLAQRAREASATADLALGISRHELLAIELLGDSGPSIMRALAEQLHLAVNTVTTLVDNLERRSLVRRERDDQDRRLVWVHLTAEGQKAHRACLDERERLCRSLLETLNEDEQEIYQVLMRKMTRQLRAIAGLADDAPPGRSRSAIVAGQGVAESS
jgi:DNA-binding MarR family transcriptional regulator